MRESFETAIETSLPICVPWTFRLRSLKLVNENRRNSPVLCKTCGVVTFLYTPTRNFSTHGYSTDLRRHLCHGVDCPTVEFAALRRVREILMIGDFEIPVFINESDDGN